LFEGVIGLEGEELFYLVDRYVGPHSTITVSSVSQCLRATWCAITGKCYVDKEMALKREIALEIGKAVHRVLERYGRGIPEKKICFEGLCGRADLVVGDDLVVEVKTTFIRNSYEYLYKHPEAICQLAFYMKAIGARKGILLLVNRVTLDFKVAFELRIDKHSKLIEKCVETLLQRSKKLKEHLEKNEEPPAEPGIWCEHCVFWRDCKAGIGSSKVFDFVLDYVGLGRWL